MNNLMLLITINNNFNELERYFKTYLEEIRYDIQCIGNVVKATKEENEIFIEYKQISRRKEYLVNIIYNKTINKKNILLELRLSQLVLNHIILFDSGSNNVIQKYSDKIMKLENLIKYYVLSSISSFHCDQAFSVIEDFKVKDDLSEKFSNQITAIQRIELNNLIQYMKDHIWGGREIPIIKKYYNLNAENDLEEGDEEERKNQLSEYIEKNIFKELLDIISSSGLGSLLYEWRNSIAHNKCVEERIFIDIGKKIDIVIEKIEGIIFNDFKIKSIFGDNIYESVRVQPTLSYIIKTDMNSEDIILRIIQVLNDELKLHILSNINECKLTKEESNIYYQYKDISLVLIKLEPEIPEIVEIYNDDTYQLKIFLNNNNYVDNTNINYRINELLGTITEQFMVMNDRISEKLCNKLYVKINNLENLVRAYIKLKEEIITKESPKRFLENKLDKMNLKISLDTDALNLQTQGTSIDLINNELFEKDFIYLLDRLSNPSAEKNYKKILKNDAIKNISLDEFNEILGDLSELDDNIKSIKNKWRELYRIRTMVAHNYIIYHTDFVNYLALFNEALEEIQKALYKLFIDNIHDYIFNFTINYGNNKLVVNKINRKYNLDFTIENKDIPYQIDEYKICNLLNSIFNLQMGEAVLVLSKEFLEYKVNEKKCEVLELSEIECREKLEKVVYGKFNLKRYDENYKVLEDAISKQLSKIARVINKEL